jgi:hypothetical protein
VRQSFSISALHLFEDDVQPIPASLSNYFASQIPQRLLKESVAHLKDPAFRKACELFGQPKRGRVGAEQKRTQMATILGSRWPITRIVLSVCMRSRLTVPSITW